MIVKSETKLTSSAIKSVSFGLAFWDSSCLLVSRGVGIRSEDPTLLHNAVEQLYWQLLRSLPRPRVCQAMVNFGLSPL